MRMSRRRGHQLIALALIAKKRFCQLACRAGRTETNRVVLEQVLAAYSLTGFFAALHVELAINTLDLRFHGVVGDDHRLSYLRVRESSHQQTQHPLLLWREWLDESCWNKRPLCRRGCPLKGVPGASTR